jgi:hypothetical protein
MPVLAKKMETAVPNTKDEAISEMRTIKAGEEHDKHEENQLAGPPLFDFWKNER